MNRFVIIAIACLVCVPACAETAAERADPAELTNTETLPTPTRVDVIAQLYQFDLFQQTALDRANSAGTTAILNTVTARADAAVKRDKALAELEKKTGTAVSSHKAIAKKAHVVSGLDSSDGPDYVRAFYEAQLVEYEATVGLLERYLRAADNEDVKTFAAAQLPLLRSELMDTRGALANK